MPENDRASETQGGEQLKQLEEQQRALQEAFDKDEMTAPEFKKESAKIAYQMAQIRDRNEQTVERQSERGINRGYERRRDLFDD